MKVFVQYFFESLGVFMIIFAPCVALIPYIYFIFGGFPWFIFIFPFLGWFCDGYVNWKEDYYGRRTPRKEDIYENDEEYY